MASSSNNSIAIKVNVGSANPSQNAGWASIKFGSIGVVKKPLIKPSAAAINMAIAMTIAARTYLGHNVNTNTKVINNQGTPAARKPKVNRLETEILDEIKIIVEDFRA